MEAYRKARSACAADPIAFRTNRLARDQAHNKWQQEEAKKAHAGASTHPQQGMIGTDGTYYAPAGGGNYIRSTDGAFMQKAAGGYINTKTGQFVPSN